MLPVKLFLFTFLIGYLAYKINNIYVIENFENPLRYKIFYSTLYSIAAISKYWNYFTGANEVSTFRKLADAFVSLRRLERIQQEFLDIKETLIQNVDVRIYSPKDKSKPLPVMVYLHGGAYVFGNTEAYNKWLIEIATRAKINIISVDYRLAPEYPFPIPTNDCLAVIEHLIANPKEFNADLSKLIVSGDSAGGNAAMVVTQHLINKNSTVIPKLQVLIYPWLQMFSFVTHSSIQYFDKGIITHLSVGQILLSYLGYQKENLTKERIQALNSNDYNLLVDEEASKRFYSYLDPSLIPEKYKKNWDYYNDKRYTQYFASRPSKLDDSNILVRDKKFADDVKKLFTPEMSPGLVDEDYLKKLPNTYHIICEWDNFKDDNLMFAERLRKSGVKSEIAYYDTCYHAMVPATEYALSRKILDDLLKYIADNI